MRCLVLAFTFGVLVLQQLSVLPPVALLCGSVVVLLACARACGWLHSRHGPVLHRALMLAAAFVAGLGWSAWRAELRLAEVLPEALEQTDVEIVGVVADLPRVYESGLQRFHLDVEQAPEGIPGRVELSWYARDWGGRQLDVPDLRPGQRWQMTVRLRRPRSLSNPHGMDREARWLQAGVRARGYVRHEAPAQLLEAFVSAPMYVVHRVREHVRERFRRTLGEHAPYAGILVALAVGDQQAMHAEHWQVFRNTGVAHLVSISGLHVSLVALFVGGLVTVLWRRSRHASLYLPAVKAGACAGVLGAGAYALMAGFGLPTQRALIMLAAGAVALVTSREVLSTRVLLLALLWVVVIDPWAVVSPGFWLSFGAVAVIMLVSSGRMQRPTKLVMAVRVQLAITLALAPVLLAAFQAFSLVSPLANAVAIPLVSFVITPVVLAAVMVPLPWLLDLAHTFTSWLMLVLQWLATQSWSMWHGPAIPLWLIAVSLCGVFLLLLPRGTPARSVAVLAVLPLFVWVPPRPEHGAFHVTVLDVGQGLAVHVQTARHDMLYDTGPGYGPVSDAGDRVLRPYLQGEGVHRLERIVLSHPHSDHSGGLRSLSGLLPVGEVVADLPAEHSLQNVPVPIRPCRAGHAWRWDGVLFQVLYPKADERSFPSVNDGSCVLRVSSQHGAVLLPGDVQAMGEWALLRDGRERLASEVVLAPHHGSRTSSTGPWVKAVQADHVIHAVGYLNPFNHPHEEVVERWRAGGTRNWRTDRDGALTVEFDAEGVRIHSQRERDKRYWHRP